LLPNYFAVFLQAVFCRRAYASGNSLQSGFPEFEVTVNSKPSYRLETMARFTLAFVMCLVALLLVQRLFGSAPATAPALGLETLPSPAGTESSEPQLTTQGNDVILSWVESSGAKSVVKFAKRTNSGWSAPKVVVSGNNLFINAADVPAVRETSNGSYVAEWLQRSGADEDSDAYDLRLSWSRDYGHTWSRAVSPHHDGTKTQHGFASLFDMPNAGLGLVWLDGRATNPQTEEGDMSLRSSTYSTDGKQLREMLVSSRVCDCCATSAAQTSDGVIVAFRNRSNAEVRDIYVSRLTATGWTTPVSVHNDGWRIDACPINGPSISASGRNVAVAWFTGLNNQGHTYVAFSKDAGQSFAAPIRVDEVASQGRVGIQLLDDGSAAVSWLEFADGKSRFCVRIVPTSGTPSKPVTISTSISGFPRIALANHELLFSWSQKAGDSSRVRLARAKLPS
jgi:hypothetical protein